MLTSIQHKHYQVKHSDSPRISYRPEIAQNFFSRYVNIALSLVMLAGAGSCFAIDPHKTWLTLSTPHFLIHHSAQDKALAQHVAAEAEAVHGKLTHWFEWQPDRQTHILLNPHMSLANGSALSIPYNRIELHTVIPPPDSSLADFSNWWRQLITHEYAHILHVDKKSGLPQTLRRWLGPLPALYPNLYQPRWLLEGLATYIETDNQQHIGRGQSSALNMAMINELNNHFKSLAQINLHSIRWPYNSAYLYGVNFFQFIEESFGAAKLKQFIAAYSNNLIPFALNTTSNEVFGLSLHALWPEYESYLRSKHALRLQDIKLQPEHSLTHEGYLAGPSTFTADNALLYIKNDGLSHPALLRRATNGTVKKLLEVQRGAQFHYHPSAGIIIAQAEICDEYSTYFDLFTYSKNSRKTKQITHCSQYHYARWHPDGEQIAAIKVHAQYSQIDLLSPDGEYIKTLWKGRQNERLAHFDWRPDGKKIITTLHQPTLGWNIFQLNVNTGTLSQLTHDDAVKSAPRYRKNGRAVVYSADYDGISNIYQLDLDKGEILKLTDSASGNFYPDSNENLQPPQLAYFEYGPTGLNLQQQALAPIQTFTVKSRLAAVTATPTPQESYATSPYKLWSSLLQPSWLPFFSVSNDQLFTGVSLLGLDALHSHQYQLNLAYESDYRQFYGQLFYQYNQRLFLNARHDNDYYFSEDSLSAILHHNELEASYHFPFSSLEKRWNLVFGGEVKRHSWENIGTFLPELDTIDEYLFGTALLFDSSHRYTRNISRTDGRQVYLALEHQRTSNSIIDGHTFTFDWREFIAISPQQTLALRAVYAKSSSASLPFYLGNESSDPFNSVGNIFNRREYPLRGYKLSTQNRLGTTLNLFSSEWRFPLFNIERSFMSPPIGSNQVHGKIFIETGAAWFPGTTEKAFHNSVGGEINAEVKLFYYYPASIRIGYARTDEAEQNHYYSSLGVSF